MPIFRGRLLFDSKHSAVLISDTRDYTFTLSSIWATITPNQIPYHQLELRSTPYTSLHLIRKGSCTFIFPDETTLTVPEGSFVLIPPGLSDKILTETRSFSKVSFRFRLEPKDTPAGSIYSRAIGLSSNIRPYAYSQNAAILAEQILGLYETPGYDMHSMLLVLTQALTLHAYDTLLKANDDKITIRDTRLAHAVDYIRRNISAEISVHQIAELVHLSPRQLNRIFLQELGVTAGEYIITSRHTRLRELVMNRELSLDDIAHMMNYNDLASLNRDFKRAECITPSQFRKNMKLAPPELSPEFIQ